MGEQVKLVEARLKDIEPNPFRDTSKYPINKEKVADFRTLFQQKGIWEGELVVRTHPDKPGKYQRAYGEHRVKAAIEEFGENYKIVVRVVPLTDGEMLQRMAQENMEDYEHDFLVDMETVRAVVNALGDGKIQLEPPNRHARTSDIRYAPSVVRGDDVPHGGDHPPYTPISIATFLGWLDKGPKAKPRVSVALAALEYIDTDVLSIEDFRGLGIKKAEATIWEANKERKRNVLAAKSSEREEDKEETKKNVARVAKHVAKRMREDKIGREQAASEAIKVSKKVKSKYVGTLSRTLVGFAAKVNKLLNGDAFAKELDAVLKVLTETEGIQEWKDGEGKRALDRIVTELLRVGPRADKYAEKFGGKRMLPRKAGG